MKEEDARVFGTLSIILLLWLNRFQIDGFDMTSEESVAALH